MAARVRRRLTRPKLPDQRAGEQAKAIFDGEALLRRLMGDRQLAGTILKGFLAGCSRPVEQFARAARPRRMHLAPGRRRTPLRERRPRLRRKRLRAIALEMERAGAAGQLDRCGELLPHVVEEFERFKSTLERTGWV